MSNPSHVCVYLLMLKANANALKLSSELLRVFVAGLTINEEKLCFLFLVPSFYFETCFLDAEAIQRAATIAEAEGSVKIEATHLERILPQLLLDF